MITPSFGLTATERVLPKLALDFTTASLDSRVTFTRTTGASNPATFVDSSGYIAAATNNQPRFDYDSVTLACKGLLIEESRANLATYSADFLNTATAGSTRPWGWTRATVSLAAGTSPDNTNTANELIEDTTASATHQITASFTVTSGAAYALSIFAKKNTRDWIALDIYDGTNHKTYFDLTNGVIGGVGSGTTAAIAALKNGWYRCSVSRTVASASVQTVINIASANNTASYTGESKSIYIWGAQLEAGAFATSYIPTTTTALTRNADVATMTGTNFSSWFNASEGTFSTVSLTASEAESSIIKTVQDTANHISIFNRSAGRIAGTVRLAGTFYTASSTGGTRNQFHTFAFGYGNNKGVGALNGGSLLNSSPQVIGLPTSTYFEIGGLGALNGYIKKIFYWPQLLTDNEVRSFSKQG